MPPTLDPNRSPLSAGPGSNAGPKRPHRAARGSGPDLSHLHPDTLRVGGVGVFAGDWAFTDGPDGTRRIPVGFVGVLTGRRNGLAVFTVTRAVADAIIDDQHRRRDATAALLAAEGLTPDQVRVPVDETYAPIWFDGEDIVVDQRSASGDPDAVWRDSPDPDGRYEIGWGWAWLAVDPADCDRIAGQIPPPGQRQEYVMLVHTPHLRVPHDRVTVTGLQQIATHNGVAFTAELALDGQYAGTIENDGNGGPTTYFGLNSSAFNWRHLHDYVQASRYRGQPVSEEFILNALVDEYDFGRQITDATKAGATLVRLLDEHGYTLDIQTARPAPATPAERAAIARQLTAQPARDPAGRMWQIWAGTAWQHLTIVPTAPTTATHADDPAAGLVVGRRYHLRYRSTTQRLDRGAVMVYLGADGDTLLFDARPAAGTQHLPRTWLLAAQAVPADTPPYLNKIER